MLSLKKLQILSVLILVVLFSGCIKKLDTDGLTLKIDESELNNSSKKFPIRESFVIANVEIEQPHIFIKENTNKIAASVNIKLAAIFLPKTNGSLLISGNPYFNKENSAIYLKDVEIEKLDFTNTNIGQAFSKTLLSSFSPVIDDIFKTMPIYKIKKDSFKGSFVKDVKIENSELLVTFGL
eukprot:GHVT01094107.1.p1 GENE.GHVT01094107.1~~GHVT01094107.1.p1  ORF type:complete len:181 (+),score=6.38 GHVT01094107.1:36-578(+)